MLAQVVSTVLTFFTEVKAQIPAEKRKLLWKSKGFDSNLILKVKLQELIYILLKRKKRKLFLFITVYFTKKSCDRMIWIFFFHCFALNVVFFICYVKVHGHQYSPLFFFESRTSPIFYMLSFLCTVNELNSDHEAGHYLLSPL